MLGNVWEWTSDWWTNKHCPRPKTDITGPDSGQDKVKKGGSFLCTTQYWKELNIYVQYIGFQLLTLWIVEVDLSITIFTFWDKNDAWKWSCQNNRLVLGVGWWWWWSVEMLIRWHVYKCWCKCTTLDKMCWCNGQDLYLQTSLCQQ